MNVLLAIFAFIFGCFVGVFIMCMMSIASAGDRHTDTTKPKQRKGDN